MLINSRKNVLFQDGGQTFLLKRGSFLTDGEIPAWVRASSFFAELVKEGSIVVSQGTSDTEVEEVIKKAEVKEKKTRKAKGK